VGVNGPGNTSGGMEGLPEIYGKPLSNREAFSGQGWEGESLVWRGKEGRSGLLQVYPAE